MNTVATPLYEWKAIRWRLVERQVFKLQKRIYQAQRRGDGKTVHRLQRLLTHSWSARCLAVRRVTQDNQGKRTAGIDGVKALSPPQRLRLVRSLWLRPEAKPTRRVWIPKPGTDEQRPLGIPTLHDRAAQALLKSALEPEWEAHFEPNSYGFRPGRSGHDAIDAIWIGINKKPKFVLDADIAKCFDRINHTALLRKLNTTPTFRRIIRAWLQAGVMDGPTLFPTDAGTPQGGVISPLLANAALHGLEAAIIATFPRWSPTNGKEGWAPIVVRYADDFVVLHQDVHVIERARQRATEWLHGLGLELKPSKTRIAHTLHEHDGEPPGFDFLGFHVRQYPVGKTHSGKQARRKDGPVRLLGFKTRITPTAAARRRYGMALKELLRQSRTLPQAVLIHRLNPVIRGWSNYYSTGPAHRIFATEDKHVFVRLWQWAKRRHRNKPASLRPALAVGEATPSQQTGVVDRRQILASRDGFVDLRCQGRGNAGTPRTDPAPPACQHVKVRGDKSPYDGDWSYWATRLGRHPELPQRVATLLHRQQGRCARCGLHFTSEDQPEIDHLLPTWAGGIDAYVNWQLLHRHCHDQKTAEDFTSTAGTHDTRPHRGGAG